MNAFASAISSSGIPDYHVVVITQTGYAGATVPLQVEDEGRIVSSQDVTLPPDGQSATVRVNFTANDGDGRDPDATDPGNWITAQDKTAFPEWCDDDLDPTNNSFDSSSWHGTIMTGIIAAQWGANFLVSFTFPIMFGDTVLDGFSRGGFAFWIYGGFGLIAAYVVLHHVPETKGVDNGMVSTYWRRQARPPMASSS